MIETPRRLSGNKLHVRPVVGCPWSIDGSPRSGWSAFLRTLLAKEFAFQEFACSSELEPSPREDFASPHRVRDLQSRLRSHSSRGLAELPTRLDFRGISQFCPGDLQCASTRRDTSRSAASQMNRGKHDGLPVLWPFAENLDSDSSMDAGASGCWGKRFLAGGGGPRARLIKTMNVGDSRVSATEVK